MKAFILAGDPLNKEGQKNNIPRTMILINNRPLLEYHIAFLKKYSIKEIVFCLYCEPKIIIDYFQDGKKYGVKISYSIEKKPLGTAGSIRAAEKFYKNEKNILIINADTMLNINLNEMVDFHLRRDNDATIALAYVSDISNYGHIICNKNFLIELFGEKLKYLHIPGTINGGIYLIKKEIIDNLAPYEKISFEKEVFPSLISLNKKICGFKNDAVFLDFSKKIALKNSILNIKKFGLKF